MLAVAAMIPPAQPFWSLLPVATLVQFPWRLLLITALTLPLAGAAVAADLESRFTDRSEALRAVIPLLIVVVCLSYVYVQAQPTPIVNAQVSPRAIVDFELKNGYAGATSYAAFTPTTSPMVPQYLQG
jgi:hypothetical protein